MRKYSVSILCILLLAGCAGNIHTSTTAVGEPLTLGEDPGSQAAMLAVQLMQATDPYTQRLADMQLQSVHSSGPVGGTDQAIDTRTHIALAELEQMHLTYAHFLTGFATDVQSTRPTTSRGIGQATFETSGAETSFTVDAGTGYTYEGKLDTTAQAGYFLRTGDGQRDYCRFIADGAGYYIELHLQQDDGWRMLCAYYSNKKWQLAETLADAEPDVDTVYHFMPDDFAHFTQHLPTLRRKMEYREGSMTYWDFARGWELQGSLQD